MSLKSLTATQSCLASTENSREDWCRSASLEVLACKELRWLISSFFFKYLEHSKARRYLEEEERKRRRSFENKNTSKGTKDGMLRGGDPFKQNQDQVFYPRKGAIITMPQTFLGIQKIPDLRVCMGNEIQYLTHPKTLQEK